MLRIVIISMIALSLSVSAEGTQYSEPGSEKREAFAEKAQRAMKEAGRLMESEKFQEDVAKERENMKGIDLQKLVEKRRNSNSMDELNYDLQQKRYFDSVENAQKENRYSSSPSGESLIVMVSLSMPDKLIREYVTTANKIGAQVALKGIVDGSIDKTIAALQRVVGEDLTKGGMLLDPTLFRRFSVEGVPTFVLTTELMEPCTDSMCPVVDHVRARGAVSIKGFLETVERTGQNEEKEVAKAWLARY